jgi:hypothetical protein
MSGPTGASGPGRVELHRVGGGEAAVGPATPFYGTVPAPDRADPVKSPLFAEKPAALKQQDWDKLKLNEKEHLQLTMWQPAGRGGRVPMQEDLQKALFRVIADVAVSSVPSKDLGDITEVLFFRDEIRFVVRDPKTKMTKEYGAAFEDVHANEQVRAADLFQEGGEDPFRDLGTEEVSVRRFFECNTRHFRGAWPAEPNPPLDLRPRRAYDEKQSEHPAPRVSRGVRDLLARIMIAHKHQGTPLGDLLDPGDLRLRRSRPEQLADELEKVLGYDRPGASKEES